MSHIETIALVSLGTIVIVIQLLRHPRPDPKLSAEPLSVTGRNVAASFGYFLFLSFLAEVLPRDLVLPVTLVITVIAIVAFAWWRRRHPERPADTFAAEAAVGPPAEVATFSTAEWVRGLVPVLVIGGLVLAAVGVASAIAAPR